MPKQLTECLAYGGNNLEQCLACGGRNLEQCLDFGFQPLANSYLKEPDVLLPCSELKVNYCHDCTHSQLSEAVDRNFLYKNYLYVSGTTDTLKKHFKDVAEYCDEPYYMKVLDIGCNDGSLLEQFKKLGYSILGIDPAANLREITKSKDIPVVVDYWTEQLAKTLWPSESHEFDVITVLNCLAHNANPLDFLLGCKRVLDYKGIILIEFPYFRNTLLRADLGQIYHEHHSYFTAQSFGRLVDRAGLEVCDLEEFPDLHGGTIRFVLRKPHYSDQRPVNCLEFDQLMEKEDIFNIKSHIDEFRKDLFNNIVRLKTIITNLKINGCNIVAYSASAKSGTLFNLPMMKDIISGIDFVVDDNPLKQGLFCPGSNLEIKHPSALKEVDNLVVLMTAHNFKKEITQRLKEMGLKNIILLNYTPDVCLEEVF